MSSTFLIFLGIFFCSSACCCTVAQSHCVCHCVCIVHVSHLVSPVCVAFLSVCIYYTVFAEKVKPFFYLFLSFSDAPVVVTSKVNVWCSSKPAYVQCRFHCVAIKSESISVIWILDSLDDRRRCIVCCWDAHLVLILMLLWWVSMLLLSSTKLQSFSL